MIQVQDWLKRSNTVLETSHELLNTIIEKTIVPDIENNLKRTIDLIHKEYIPEGQKLRDSWKDRSHGKTTYDDIKKRLAKLHLAAQGLHASHVLYRQLTKQCPEFSLKCTSIK